MINERDVFQFDEFKLDIQGRALLRADVDLTLVGKAFDVLVYLARNHERVVPHEEIFYAIWRNGDSSRGDYDPQYVQQAISAIRAVLGDTPRAPKYIATYRRHGFRFIGKLAAEFPADGSANLIVKAPASRQTQWSLTAFLLAGSVAIALVLIIIFLGSAPQPILHVVDSVPLTHDGETKYAPVLADGERAYFTEIVGGRYTLMTVDLRSMETAIIPSTISDPYLCDVSADSRLLLVRSVVGGFDDYGPLFIQPRQGGQAQALPVSAFDGAWSADARSVVFARGNEVSRFDLETHQTRLLTTVKGYAWWPRFSPDKKRLRFTLTDEKTQGTSIWEIPASGGEARLVFGPDTPWAAAGSGNWTRDGRYFVFQVGPRAASNIWVLDEMRSFFSRPKVPVQLTFGPSYRGPQPTPDGSAIFARTQLQRGEMFKFARGRPALPILSGISTDMVAYSPDGQWIVYCLADREKTLWLSHIDGSGAHRLTDTSTESAYPQWSPDGRFIAVATRRPKKAVWTISVIAFDGSVPSRELTLLEGNALHPSWSPDSKQILFGTIPTLQKDAYLYTVNLATGRVVTVPGSENLFVPAWSPDGRFVAALSSDSYQLVLLDTVTTMKSILTETKAGFPVWSRDGKSIYSVQRCQNGMCVYRLERFGHERHQAIALGQFPLLDRWIGIDPDGALLLAKNVSVQEIEALKLEPKLSKKR